MSSLLLHVNLFRDVIVVYTPCSSSSLLSRAMRWSSSGSAPSCASSGVVQQPATLSSSLSDCVCDGDLPVVQCRRALLCHLRRMIVRCGGDLPVVRCRRALLWHLHHPTLRGGVHLLLVHRCLCSLRLSSPAPPQAIVTSSPLASVSHRQHPLPQHCRRPPPLHHPRPRPVHQHVGRAPLLHQFINNADDDTFYIRIDYHVLYINVFGDGIFCINTVGYRILYMISSMATSSTSTSSTSTSPT